MAKTATYAKIATTTLGSAAPSYTFTSISGSYTDLIIVAQIKTDAAASYLNLRFNGDTGSNYSRTVLSGNGSTASSSRNSNATAINTDYNEQIQNNFNYISIIHIMDYANTTTYKTALIRPNNAATGAGVTVGLWRSTSAITSVAMVANNNNFEVGTTFTLYGIEDAK